MILSPGFIVQCTQGGWGCDTWRTQWQSECSKLPKIYRTDSTTVNNLAQDVHHPNIEEPWVKEYLHFESYSCHQIFPYNVVTCHVSARNIRESPLLLVPKFSAHIWQTFKFFLMAILWKMADFLDHILS